MWALTQQFTLEDHIKLGTATEEEQTEWNLLQRLKRVKEGKETRLEKAQGNLLELLHAEWIEQLAMIQRAIRNAAADIRDALQMMPTINPYSHINSTINKTETL